MGKMIKKLYIWMCAKCGSDNAECDSYCFVCGKKR